jgi:hypothetical protein
LFTLKLKFPRTVPAWWGPGKQACATKGVKKASFLTGNVSDIRVFIVLGFEKTHHMNTRCGVKHKA